MAEKKANTGARAPVLRLVPRTADRVAGRWVRVVPDKVIAYSADSLDRDGELRARLRELSREERHRWLDWLMNTTELPKMHPGFYRGHDAIVAAIDEEEAQREHGANARRQAQQLLERVARS